MSTVCQTNPKTHLRRVAQYLLLTNYTIQDKISYKTRQDIHTTLLNKSTNIIEVPAEKIGSLTDVQKCCTPRRRNFNNLRQSKVGLCKTPGVWLVGEEFLIIFIHQNTTGARYSVMGGKGGERGCRQISLFWRLQGCGERKMELGQEMSDLQSLGSFP